MDRARRCAEGHQVLSEMRRYSPKSTSKTGLGSRLTKEVGSKSKLTLVELYLGGWWNRLPARATTSQPVCHAFARGSGLVEVIQPLSDNAEAARVSLSSGTRMSTR
jgi:hypothetical protein